jgi:hypothetical protein
MKRIIARFVCFLILATSTTVQGQTLTNITVDWRTILSRLTPGTFGTNDFQITSSQSASDETYHNLLVQNGLKLLRFHNANLSNAWSSATTRTWDATLVQQAYSAYNTAYDGQLPTIIQNIPNWPSWMTQNNGILDPSEYDEYANFCASLVGIINRDLHQGVVYWEPLNEMEKVYAQAGKLNDLWTIYNRAAVAMKAVDPSIKVGGPALSYNDTAMLTSFLQASGANVDFVSWHRYNGGDPSASTSSILANTPNYAGSVTAMRNVVNQYLPGKTVELQLGEYNINYNYASGENRQNTYIGAIWFASVQKYLAESSIDQATQWNAKDDYYGLYDYYNNPRLSATVFHWTNHYFVGDVVKTTSNQSGVEAFAVAQADGSKSILLINKLNTSTSVSLSSLGQSFGTGNLSIQKLGENGVSTVSMPATSISPGPFTLGAYSLWLLRLPSPPLVSISGNNQQGTVGNRLSLPLVVKVIDGSGNPVSGINVQFAPTSGQVSTTSQNTNSQGQAQTYLTLGTVSGTVNVMASIANSTPLTLTATAVSGSVHHMTIQGATTGVTASSIPFVATLYDQYNNLVTASTTPVSVTASNLAGNFAPASPLAPVSAQVQTSFTPSAIGSGSILFKSGSVSMSQPLSVAAPLSIPTNYLPNGTVSIPYATTLIATGGTPPYLWTISGGTITPGLSLSSSGILSGTPTTVGTFNTGYKVVDAVGRSYSRSLNVRIYAP